MKYFSFILFIALMVGACAPENNSLIGIGFHNVNAHFNGYYYAREDAMAVEKTIIKSLDDDHNLILRLFPKLDTTLAKSYVSQTDEIIKMASISIQRHPNSRWVDDNYIMVGMARLFACDYQNAILTFKYVNQKSTDANIRHRALVLLIRTFIEQGDYAKAEEAANYLSKEKLNKTNAKNLLMEKAYLFQVQNDYNKMVQNLSAADSLLTRQDRKGRIYFIIGQVYQKLGFSSEAYNYYRKCLATNPEYEIDFYARLNMAQVARLDNKSNIKSIRAQFVKMLKDEKNKEFKDKIYYEMGEFELKQDNIGPAIENYKHSVHAGTNKRIQGMAFLQLGKIHFDTLRKFSLAKAYYDSSLTTLPKDFENYAAIKKRQEILVDFVKYSETITLQDSLLTLAKLDTATLHKKMDSIQVAREEIENQKEKKRKKKQSDDSSGPGNTGGAFYPAETNTTADWYFGNPTAVAFGQSEFQRIWGTVNLEDNWRRSLKSSAPREDTPTIAAANPTTTGSQDSGKPGEKTEVKKKKSIFDELYQQLPKTDNDISKALGLIEEAYFKLGDLNYFKLREKEDARAMYEKLIARFPDSDHKPEVLYKLYLIAKEIKPDDAPRYADALKQEFPTSTYTKILLNPDYLKETSITAEKQKIIYKEAYIDFQQGQLVASTHKIDEAIGLGESGFIAQLDLLKVLITGKTEDIARYQYELGEFVKKYPDNPIISYAKDLLDASKKFQAREERAKGIRFTRSPNEPHQFLIVHKITDKLSTPFIFTLDKFNKEKFGKQQLQTSNLGFSDELTMTFVLEFKNMAEARNYYDQVKETVLKLPEFANFKLEIFIISKENFGTFYRTRALDEYLAFYDRNY